MLIPIGIIYHGLVLDGFLRHREIQMDGASFVRSGENRQFQGGQRLSCIAVSLFGQMLKGILVRGDLVRAKASFGIGKSSLEEEEEVLG